MTSSNLVGIYRGHSGLCASIVLLHFGSFQSHEIAQAGSTAISSSSSTPTANCNPFSSSPVEGMSNLTLILFFALFWRSSSTAWPYAFLPPPDVNHAIYDATKALCLGCWAQSIQFLYAHNVVRAAHLELPLLWDPALESYARWWASQRQADCRLLHSFPEGGSELGENIFWGSGSDWSPMDAVRDWAAEERDYSYTANACAPGRMCGHYTQIVWRDTRRVGCARVVCDDGGVFITCNYYPPGNYVGERPY